MALNQYSLIPEKSSSCVWRSLPSKTINKPCDERKLFEGALRQKMFWLKHERRTTKTCRARHWAAANTIQCGKENGILICARFSGGEGEGKKASKQRHIKCQVYSRAARKFTSSSKLVSGSVRELFTNSFKSKACNQSNRAQTTWCWLIILHCAGDAHVEIESVTHTCSEKETRINDTIRNASESWRNFSRDAVCAAS